MTYPVAPGGCRNSTTSTWWPRSSHEAINSHASPSVKYGAIRPSRLRTSCGRHSVGRSRRNSVIRARLRLASTINCCLMYSLMPECSDSGPSGLLIHSQGRSYGGFQDMSSPFRSFDRSLERSPMIEVPDHREERGIDEVHLRRVTAHALMFTGCQVRSQPGRAAA